MTAHTPSPTESTDTKSPTFYQQEQKNPMLSPEQPEFHVELDRKKLKISGEISWQQLRPLLKPIGLLATHLATAGITWISTLQNQPKLPNPPSPPAIEHCQPKRIQQSQEP